MQLFFRTDLYQSSLFLSEQYPEGETDLIWYSLPELFGLILVGVFMTLAVQGFKRNVISQGKHEFAFFLLMILCTFAGGALMFVVFEQLVYR